MKNSIGIYVTHFSLKNKNRDTNFISFPPSDEYQTTSISFKFAIFLKKDFKFKMATQKLNRLYLILSSTKDDSETPLLIYRQYVDFPDDFVEKNFYEISFNTVIPSWIDFTKVYPDKPSDDARINLNYVSLRLAYTNKDYNHLINGHLEQSTIFETVIPVMEDTNE